MHKTAILVDGGFFVKRYQHLYRNRPTRTPNQIARDLYGGLLRGMRQANEKSAVKRPRELYRIIFYDCAPLVKRVQNLISKKGINFGDSPQANFRNGLHAELKKMRKVALRLGRIDDNNHWQINRQKTKELLTGKIQVADLTEKDIFYSIQQKGVDMKIGLDIASLAYKGAVDQIILIAGDSDFVPASKLARREGIDFVLDSMGNHVNADLHEHIDGMVSGWGGPSLAVEPVL